MAQQADDKSERADIEIRPARAEDREAVFAFTARTWDDGDYIPYVWEQWLTDPTGALLVAARAGRAVGMTHVQMLSADEAWLEGIRVDPAVRREGLGRALTARALAVARERGAKVARLFTDEDNLASQQMVTGFGFDRVASFTGYVAPADPRAEPHALPPGSALRAPGTGDLERVWAFLKASNLVPLNGGLLVQAWRAYSINTALLERRLALALRQMAAREGLAEVRALLPDEVLILRDAMDGAGYAQRDDHATWCYARTL